MTERHYSQLLPFRVGVDYTLRSRMTPHLIIVSEPFSLEVDLKQGDLDADWPLGCLTWSDKRPPCPLGLLPSSRALSLPAKHNYLHLAVPKDSEAIPAVYKCTAGAHLQLSANQKMNARIAKRFIKNCSPYLG